MRTSLRIQDLNLSLIEHAVPAFYLVYPPDDSFAQVTSADIIMSMLSSFLFFSLIVSDFARRSNLPQGHKHVILLSCRSSVMLAIFRFMVYCELFLTSEIVRVWD